MSFRMFRFFALCIATALLPSLALAQLVPAPSGKTWSPTFSADFSTGQSDLTGWTYDLGNGPNHDGWGNGEVENYTNSTSNVSVSSGLLHLTAVGAKIGNNTTYTSGRIRTTTLFSQAYGLFEFRAKLPAGVGLWPAIWMMPEKSVYGAWPNSGEIDVLESTGDNHNFAQGSLHTGTSPGALDNQSGAYSPPGFDTTAFHTYDLQWSPGPSPSQPATFRWYVDGSLYETHTGGWVVPSGAPNKDAPFDQPFFLIMDLAVSGNFTGFETPGPGAYDMQVDFAHAFQLTTPAPEPTTAAMLALVAPLLLRRRRQR